MVDFGSVVVHIFDEPMRPFYNLDGLWSDAPRFPVPEAEEADELPSEDTTDVEVDPHP
ncbi:MAG: RsfS/YbeB/iojap family protein [Myxococcota bacterium]